MKYISIIFLLPFFSFKLFAQETHEDFISEIIQSSDSILLLEAKSDLFITDDIAMQLKSKIPKDIVDELIIKNKEYRIKKTPWDFSQIKNSQRVTSKDSLGLLIYEDFNTADSLYRIAYDLDTIKDVKILENKIDSLYEAGISSNEFRDVSINYKYTSIYSYPVISENGKWAIIEQVKYVRSLNASGAIYLYKKKRKKWKLIGTVNKWVS